MKKLIDCLAGCAGWRCNCSAAEWLTDLPKALDKAKAENKMVLMDFTGSDWCPPCKALHKTVLTSPEFEAYAQTNLVLVEVDFPNRQAADRGVEGGERGLGEEVQD